MTSPAPDSAAPARVLRQDAIRDGLRARYDDACQICGRTIHLDETQTYAETHSLAAPGLEEPASAEPSQLLVVCPEHHALLDLGALALNPETLRLRSALLGDELHGKPLVHARHELDAEALHASWDARLHPADDDSEDGGARRGHPSVESTLRALMVAALDEDEERGFAGYVELLLDGPSLPDVGRRTLRQFGWAQLRRRAAGYVLGGDPARFRIVDQRPGGTVNDGEKTRFMLDHSERNAAPVVLLQTPDGRWWLDFCGL